MSIKVPATLQVVGKVYKCLFDHKLRDAGCNGRTDWDAYEIMLNPVTSQQQKEETYFHEILHAVDRHCNYNSLDDKAIDALSEGLYQSIRQLGIELDFSEWEVRDGMEDKKT